VIYLTTSARYDDAADAVVVLDGPTAVDGAADEAPATDRPMPEPLPQAAATGPAA